MNSSFRIVTLIRAMSKQHCRALGQLNAAAPVLLGSCMEAAESWAASWPVFAMASRTSSLCTGPVETQAAYQQKLEAFLLKTDVT